MITIKEIDIEQFIDGLLAQGYTSDIAIALYDYRVNGIDTLEKAETAYNDYLKSKGEIL